MSTSCSIRVFDTCMQQARIGQPQPCICIYPHTKTESSRAQDAGAEGNRSPNQHTAPDIPRESPARLFVLIRLPWNSTHRNNSTHGREKKTDNEGEWRSCKSWRERTNSSKKPIWLGSSRDLIERQYWWSSEYGTYVFYAYVHVFLCMCVLWITPDSAIQVIRR